MTGAGIRRLAFGACALFWAGLYGVAHAASPPAAPPTATSCDSCSTSLSVTATTGRVALPVNVGTQPSLNAVTIYNIGTKDSFYKLSDAACTATTTNTRAPAGVPVVVYVNGATYLCAITAGSDTTTLQIWQGNGPMLGRAGSAGGGSATPSGPAGGDLAGTYPNPTVAGIGNVSSGALSELHGGAGVISGVLKGNGSGVVSQAACADLSNAGTGCTGTLPVGANPSATIGASGVNGSASTFMRSDAAPPLPATLPALNGSLLTNLSGGNLTAGSVANAALTNPATTVNGQTCTLGSTCTVTAAATSVTVGTTTVSGGVSGRILYDNGGTLAENTVTGTGSVVQATGPTLVSPALGTPTTLVLTNASGLPDSALSANVPRLNATNAFTGNNALGGSFTLSGRTDATIVADQNNWTPTGTGTYANSSEVFVDGGASDRNITGLTGGAPGRIVGIVNKGSTNSIIIKNSSGSSSAANQFLLPADVTLPPNTALEMRYDGTTLAWRPWGRALANTGVTAGSYTLSSVTVDVAGRVTAASSASSTGSGAVVLAGSPTGTGTWVLPIVQATSGAFGSATIGTDAIAATGTMTVSGAVSLGNVNVTASTIPPNGIYLSAANQLAFSTNGSQRFILTSGGQIQSSNSTGWALNSGAGNCTTNPTLVGVKTATTTGYSGDGAKLCGVVGGIEKVDWTANGELTTGYVQAGSITAYTGLQAGDIAMTYHSDAATAPGAGGCYLAIIPATTTGHKLIMRCNTATTAVTIVDNVGN